MSALPPFDSDDSATKQDLDVLGSDLRAEMAELRTELRREFADLRDEIHQGFASATRTLVLWQISSVFIAGSVSFAAATLV